mmetsp:Transcript_11038/g.20024  ORF Transcript_11038/g.20024 Transcript_11038/m.20024 type:complete len:211 (-) Transcript_11038:984-1616(-)
MTGRVGHYSCRRRLILLSTWWCCKNSRRGRLPLTFALEVALGLWWHPPGGRRYSGPARSRSLAKYHRRWRNWPRASRIRATWHSSCGRWLELLGGRRCKDSRLWCLPLSAVASVLLPPCRIASWKAARRHSRNPLFHEVVYCCLHGGASTGSRSRVLFEESHSSKDARHVVAKRSVVLLVSWRRRRLRLLRRRRCLWSLPSCRAKGLLGE